jgi:outer membrane protein assembly factor BamA
LSRSGRVAIKSLLGKFLIAIALLGCPCTARPQQQQVITGKILVSGDSTGLGDSIAGALKDVEGQPLTPDLEAAVHQKVQNILEAHGYLEATVAVAHESPRTLAGKPLADLSVNITPGRQYRISAISAGGGPLLPSRDFSPSFTSKPGDIAGSDAFGRAPEELRTYYWRYGYADVAMHVSTDLDKKQATAAYRLDVIPGPLYHVRTLSIENLNPDQESEVRRLLGLKPGDVFDQAAVTSLYRKLSGQPQLAGYTFTYKPVEDKATAQVDLTLTFSKKAATGLIFH